MAALKGRRIRVIPDGPLTRFPLQALVTKLPPRRPLGHGPQFVGQLLDLQYAFVEQTPGAPTAKSDKRAVVGPMLEGRWVPRVDGPACGAAQMVVVSLHFRVASGVSWSVAITSARLRTNRFACKSTLHYFAPIG